MDLNNGRILTGKLNFFLLFFLLISLTCRKKEKRKIGWWIDVLDHYDRGEDSMELWRKHLKTNQKSFWQPSFCVHCNQKFLRMKVRNLSETISNIKSIIIKNSSETSFIYQIQRVQFVTIHPINWLIDPSAHRNLTVWQQLFLKFGNKLFVV